MKLIIVAALAAGVGIAEGYHYLTWQWHKAVHECEAVADIPSKADVFLRRDGVRVDTASRQTVYRCRNGEVVVR